MTWSSLLFRKPVNYKNGKLRNNNPSSCQQKISLQPNNERKTRFKSLPYRRLDIHEDKLCLELHNFDFISTNTTQYTSSTPTSSSTSSASEKRSLLYGSLTSDKNLSHTLPYENKNQIRKGFIYVAINEDNLVDDPPATKKTQKAFRFSVYQTDATSF